MFGRVPDKHAPLKCRKVRGNQSTLVTKEANKAIMNKSKTRNKYPVCKNLFAYEKVWNLLWESKKNFKNSYLRRVTESGFAYNKKFCNTVKEI